MYNIAEVNSENFQIIHSRLIQDSGGTRLGFKQVVGCVGLYSSAYILVTRYIHLPRFQSQEGRRYTVVCGTVKKVEVDFGGFL